MIQKFLGKHMHFLGGDDLYKAVQKQIPMLFLIFLLFVLYITNFFNCTSKISEIGHLQQQLRELQYELVSVSATLTEKTRPSQVEEMIKQQGLDIQKATTPPYKLKDK